MTDKLLTGDPETFLGEFQDMDLSEINDDTSTFMVAQQSGDPKGPKYVPSTLRGPYTFYEMVEEAAKMWRDEQVHAKVVYCEKDRDLPLRWLDECTIDYIEARWEDIITEGFLGGVFDEVEFDVKAGIISEDDFKEEDKNAEQEVID